jgi:hypothetical protein
MPNPSKVVTLGRATAEPLTKTPKVTIGSAYGQADNGASSIEFKELTGDERRIVLSERALPYKPLSFGGKQRVENTSYTGFPQKSQQALGAEEDESSWTGAWKTRFIGDTATRMAQVSAATSTRLDDGTEAIAIDDSTIHTAAELVELFDDVRRKGQVVRVQWLHIARVGRLVSFTQKWLTAHDVEWEMKWDWIGRDEDAGAPSPGSAQLLDLSHQLSTGYVEVLDATDFDAVDGLDPSFADKIDYRVGRLQRSILELEDAIENRVSSVTGPIEALRRAASLATFVRDESELLIADLTSQTEDAIITVENPEDLTTVPAGVMTAAACNTYRAIRSARILKHRGSRERFRAMKELDANALAVVLMAQDQDCHDLSAAWYGTPDEGERIRAYNNLLSMTAPAGTVIVIPVRR